LLAETNTSSGALVYQENDRYDVFGNRVEEDITQNGTTTVTKQAYDANGVCYADISGTGSIVTRRVNLDATDALFARIGQTGTVAWYLTDHLGSVTGLMNNSGSLIDALVYDAYGNVTSETSPSSGDRYAYTGRERDLEAHLQYNRARWYNGATNLAGNLCSGPNSVSMGSPGK
jgi:YD repeat-containing protein